MRLGVLSFESLFELIIDFILVPERHPAYALYLIVTVLLGWYFEWVFWSYWQQREEREQQLYGPRYNLFKKRMDLKIIELESSSKETQNTEEKQGNVIELKEEGFSHSGEREGEAPLSS